MDEMKIASKFTTNMISKLIRMVLHKKMGYNVGIQLNMIDATVVDGTAHVRLDVDAELGKDELMKILKEIGLN